MRVLSRFLPTVTALLLLLLNTSIGVVASPHASPAAEWELEPRSPLVCRNDFILALVKGSQFAPQAKAFCSSYIPGTTVTVATTASTTTTPAAVTASVSTTVTSIVTSVVPSVITTVAGVATTVTIAPGAQINKRSAPKIPSFLSNFLAAEITSVCSCAFLPTHVVSVTSLATKTASGQTISTTVTKLQVLTSVSVSVSTSTIQSVASTATVCNPAASIYPLDSPPQLVNLRVEGAVRTIFEGNVLSGGGMVRTPSGGLHICDGTNLGVNPSPGNTCTTTLATAAVANCFTFDGTWEADFEDYFITQIGGDSQTSTVFWGLLVNFQFTPVSGCQQETQAGDQVLWAYDAFNKAHFLKLTTTTPTVAAGSTISLTVTDGQAGGVISGATIAGQGGPYTSDSNGVVSFTLSTPGTYSFKASRSDSLRSNAIEIVVT